MPLNCKRFPRFELSPLSNLRSLLHPATESVRANSRGRTPKVASRPEGPRGRTAERALHSTLNARTKPRVGLTRERGARRGDAI